MSDALVFQTDGPIATIRLNRPEKRNAFTVEMIDEWVEALTTCRDDDRIKAIVLTGTGDRAFCSGGDVGRMRDPKDATAVGRKSKLFDHIHHIPLLLEGIDKPYLVAVNGAATGAGMDMALMGDIRFAAQSARFGETYIKVGLVPGDGGAYYLPRLVGIPKALELLWTGDLIDADEALRLGIINRVYPDKDLMSATYEFAERLANGPSLAIRMTKRAVYQSERQDLRSALDLISSHMGIIATTEDHKEAVRAFAEKRKPVFNGR
ncbi:MAG: enoyl-CoA hydratase-related protein [Roseovarius sp.]|nr:enoyl-CoA hydratase-related protein [Roseovarius sp.]